LKLYFSFGVFFLEREFDYSLVLGALLEITIANGKWDFVIETFGTYHEEKQQLKIQRLRTLQSINTSPTTFRLQIRYLCFASQRTPHRHSTAAPESAPCESLWTWV
jgi:hypothetical protein